MNKKILITMISMAIIIIILLSSTGILYMQNQNLNQQENTVTDYSNENFYYDILVAIEKDNADSKFAPTVDMFDALMTAFNYNGWPLGVLEELNRTKVDIRLVYGYLDESTNSTVVLNTVTFPHTSYAHVVEDGITYRFMWQIIVYNATSSLMPLTHDGYSVVDAETGEVLPIPSS